MIEYIFLIGCILFVSILLAIMRPRLIGYSGEKRVASLLQRLPETDYVVVNDLLLPVNGRTTQIDHVVVSLYGIFVIETKNYSGMIYGGEHSETWTKNVDGNKYTIPNPIRQNRLHVAAISSILNDIRVFCPVYSVIAFSNNANVRVGNVSCEMAYFHQLKSVILKYTTPRITKEKVDLIVQHLQSVNIVDKQQRKRHIQDVRSGITEKHLAIANGICPRCGGTLVERHGKYGTFYGCVNYPKCKFTTT